MAKNKVKTVRPGSYPHSIKGTLNLPRTEVLNGVKIEMPESPNTDRTSMEYFPRANPDRLEPHILPWSLLVKKAQRFIGMGQSVEFWQFRLSAHHEKKKSRITELNLREAKDLHTKLGKAIAWVEAREAEGK